MDRAVKPFRNGGSRAVRIPREFKLEGENLIIEQHGDGVLIRPARSKLKELLEYLENRGPLAPEDRMPEIEDHPPGDVEL